MADPARIFVEESLAPVQCCVCGIHFAMPEYLRQERHRTKALFYCPNGHSQSYTQSEAERLRKELERITGDRDWQKARAEKMDRELIAAKGQMTKLRRRLSNGVCPCCHRSFDDLKRHMTSKHPEYKER